MPKRKRKQPQPAPAPAPGPARRLHRRPEPRTQLVELIELRLRKYPDMMQRDFAKKLLGITRLHMTAIEVGRRVPSPELAVRWVAALAPEARLSMFGPLPEAVKQVRTAKLLREVDPEVYEAA